MPIHIMFHSSLGNYSQAGSPAYGQREAIDKLITLTNKSLGII
jgi:hypothetical protein